MGLAQCFACGRQRIIQPIKKGVQYTCSHCGAKQVKIVRSRAHASYIAWCDKEGIDAEKARHDTYAGLRGYAERRATVSNKKGWCANKFREIFGTWPNGEGTESAAPASSGLLWWIKRENIAYAKRKREEEGGLANLGDRVSVWGADGVDATSSLMTDDDWGVKL